METARACASSGFSIGSLAPGTVGTSERRASWRPAVFEPRASMASAEGPMKTRLVSSQARGSGTDGVGFVRETDVQGCAVGFAEDDDGADAEFAAGAQNANGDFAAIGD